MYIYIYIYIYTRFGRRGGRILVFVSWSITALSRDLCAFLSCGRLTTIIVILTTSSSNTSSHNNNNNPNSHNTSIDNTSRHHSSNHGVVARLLCIPLLGLRVPVVVVSRSS